MNHRTTAPGGGDEPSDELTEKYLLTEGVTSTVLVDEVGNRTRGIGHVTLLDWDGHVTPVEAVDMARDGSLVGPTFVFESSPGSYHGWNVVVRRFSETCDALDRANDDTGHTEVGVGRGWWRLRVGSKRHADDREYKPAPRFVRTVMAGGSESFRVSDPHLELARVCGVPASHVESVRRNHRPVGDSMEVVGYVTMTDIEKHVRRAVVSDEPLGGGEDGS